MHRWLAILLLALLPLQFSWAAVAAYCGHESGAASRHLGHHEHQHAGAAGAGQLAGPDAALVLDAPDAADPAAQGDSPAGLDFDCGHCHSSCAAMPAPVDDLASPAPGLRPVNTAAPGLRSLSQRPPERPQWAGLA